MTPPSYTTPTTLIVFPNNPPTIKTTLSLLDEPISIEVEHKTTLSLLNPPNSIDVEHLFANEPRRKIVYYNHHSAKALNQRVKTTSLITYPNTWLALHRQTSSGAGQSIYISHSTTLHPPYSIKPRTKILSHPPKQSKHQDPPSFPFYISPSQ